MRPVINDKKSVYMSVAIFILLSSILAIYVTPLKFLNLVSPTMNEIDSKDFYTSYLRDPSQYIFVDVRSPSIYISAHAKGSISIPIENLYNEHYSLPHSGKKIVLICTSGRLAAVAYGYLQYWGFLNLLHVQGGLQSWTAEGMPIEGANVPLVPNYPNRPVLPDEHQ